MHNRRKYMNHTYMKKHACKTIKSGITISVTLLCFSQHTLAALPSVDALAERLSTYTLDCGHWYVGGNIGMSHLHDDPNPGTHNSVDEDGAGGSVVGGYQLNSLLG